MKLFSKTLLSFAILLLVPGCISNIFKEPKPTFSKDIVLPEFNSDFNQLRDNVYPAWKSKETGNVISVISDCNDGNFTLKSIHGLMSDSLDQVKVVQENSTTVTGRKSYFKIVRGQIEGKAIEIQSYSLQNGKCTYLTSLAGNPEKLKLDEQRFKNFLQKIEFKK
jgi:hypothetical protein